MIYVGGVPFSSDDSSRDGSIKTLAALMEHPLLVAASNSFKLMSEKKISVLCNSSAAPSTTSKWIYLFQREFATVCPALVDLVGTDEATTCVGIAIRNPRTGMASVAHMDFPSSVDTGLSQMLSLITEQDYDTPLDVHIMGSFVDISSQQSYCNMIKKKKKNQVKLEGYSYPLCAKIIEALQTRSQKFHIQTLHVLEHNTRWDSEGTGYPVFHGFALETSTGSIFPASFDETTRCPDEIVRRIRVTASFEDPDLRDKLLDTYDTRKDLFVITPSTWTIHKKQIALMLQNRSDAEILQTCSSSPYAESPEFVENVRRTMEYLIQHPHWEETFPLKKARVFKRREDGSWIRLNVAAVVQSEIVNYNLKESSTGGLASNIGVIKYLFTPRKHPE